MSERHFDRLNGSGFFLFAANNGSAILIPQLLVDQSNTAYLTMHLLVSYVKVCHNMIYMTKLQYFIPDALMY